MPRFIALLRGINVGGRNKVAMSALRDLFAELGFAGAQSVLQSGNLVFESTRRTPAALELVLEEETPKRLSVAADYMVRGSKEWEQIIARNPFPQEATNDPAHLVVMFLKAVPPPASVQALRAAVKGPEVLHCDGRQLYVVYPVGIGPSKLTGTLIEQKLGVRGTARNWNTVLRLAALCK
jgi:uncharacterized protein (DUF1697 family)